ncbi:MAG: malonyl-ACP O-methyltransferase BioC [Methylovulum miyakonense]|uniref:malonyl-ACP O-methyltransferase BioC n=1 Tax=Methylovulum miyakonense TaxID=645578 RepID=UPI003BB5DB42
MDKRKIKQAFSAAAASYDGAAQLQRRVGTALLQLADLANQHGTLLDIGCGTGFLTGELLALSPCQELIALDMALPMLHATRQKLSGHTNVHYLCADAEALPLADQSVDGVYSNLALQWCGDLQAVFADIRRVLKPDGQLVFSTFGTETLQELKNAWATEDNYQHVNDFHDETYLIDGLQQAGFRAIHSQRQHHQPRYASVLELMRELKHLGAHNVLPRRNKGVTGKTALQRMMAAYPRNPQEPTISATFDVIMVSAKR